jgi:NADH-quinone oxidoreductase subunit G
VVLLVGLEPEEESPIIFLRLRKAVRKHGLKVVTLAAFASYASQKLNATLVPVVPGAEALSLAELPQAVADLLREPGAVILVGADATTRSSAAAAELSSRAHSVATQSRGSGAPSTPAFAGPVARWPTID